MLSTLKSFDLFGVPVNFFINGNTKLKSPLSACLSLSTIMCILAISILIIIDWVRNTNPRIIPSAQNYSITELLSKNLTISHTFTHENYYAYFSPYIQLPDGTKIGRDNITNYFDFWYDFLDQNQKLSTIESVKCSVEEMDRFLLLDDQTIKNDAGKISLWGVCIKNPLQMGLFPYPTIRAVNRTQITFKLGPCKNSSQNNHHCKPITEIYDMAKYVKIQAAIPQTFFDFKPGNQMRKRGYNYELLGIDKSVTRTYTNFLLPTTVMTDFGLLYEDYKEAFTDFNFGLETFDQILRTEQNDLMFTYGVYLAYNSDVYFRQNQRLNDVAGSIGGIINIILLIAKLIGVAYNSFYLNYLLVSTSFSEVQKNDKNEKNDKNDNDEPQKKKK